ncbi:Signal transduction response regulator, receiver region domain protein [Candidatus Omnitrophus magneticus]|uniref:Signal transduction response regulator, receiver region domain protein n=1 Tax=Candidatus Omnitrophus magneticus TaxID=1609969 RepID=A0A0F0CQ14_9BACT|nr:Signal transduction response regulator, receiver region domain protein [Candidatus Omnitrophus magneticus]
MNKKILIVDDSKTALLMMKTLFEEESYEVHSAETGQEGVRLSENVHPDIIILDTILPDIDGFEVCKKIKSQSTNNMPKIIVMTGSIDAVDASKAKKSGADDYIVKTSDFSYLLNSVKSIV